MHLLDILLISLLPVCIIAYYVYNKDYDKEPSELLITLLVGGVLSVIPAALIELSVQGIFPDEKMMTSTQKAVYILIDIAFVEEVLKWITVYIVGYNSREFDYMYDAIVYCVFASLGFAAIENILYVAQHGLHIGLFRAILSVPAHACFGVVMGVFIAYAKRHIVKNNDVYSALMLICSIMIPSILHAIYDYCLIMGTKNHLLFFLGFVVILYVVSFSFITKLAKERKHIYYTQTLNVVLTNNNN